MKAQTEVEKFLEGTDVEQKVNLDDTTVPEKDKVEDPDPEDVPESLKDRQHRRLEKRLQAERETNIVLNERLKAKDEVMQHVTKEAKIDDRLLRLFGSDEKGIEISKHFTEILAETRGQARAEALAELKELERTQREAEKAQVKSYESKIESSIESIEDEYNVSLPSGSKARTEFLDFVSRIAPKDEDGNPRELPDLIQAYEIFKDKKPAPANTRQKDIASRSMQSSGKANLQKEELDETERWLNQNGIKTRNKVR